MKYRVLLWTGKWAGYVDRDIESQASFTEKALECLPNRLTPLYSKIHYKEENYLKVRTKLLIYPSPLHSKGFKYVGMLVHWYVAFLHSRVLMYWILLCNSATPYFIILLVLSVPRPVYWFLTNISFLLILIRFYL